MKRQVCGVRDMEFIKLRIYDLYKPKFPFTG